MVDFKDTTINEVVDAVNGLRCDFEGELAMVKHVQDRIEARRVTLINRADAE